MSLRRIRKFDILEIGHLNSFSPAWMNDSGRRAIKDREGLERLEDASKRGLINDYKMFIIINTSLERFRAASFTSRMLCAFQMTVSVYVREGRSHQPTVKQFQQRLLSTSLNPVSKIPGSAPESAEHHINFANRTIHFISSYDQKARREQINVMERLILQKLIVRLNLDMVRHPFLCLEETSIPIQVTLKL